MIRKYQRTKSCTEYEEVKKGYRSMVGRKIKTNGRRTRNEQTRLTAEIPLSLMNDVSGLLRARHGLTLREVLCQALEGYLHPERTQNILDEVRVEHSNLKKELGAIRYDLNVLLSTMLAYVRVWIPYQTEFSEKEWKTAWTLSKRRWTSFNELVAEYMTSPDILLRAKGLIDLPDGSKPEDKEH